MRSLLHDAHKLILHHRERLGVILANPILKISNVLKTKNTRKEKGEDDGEEDDSEEDESEEDESEEGDDEEDYEDEDEVNEDEHER